MSTTYKNPICIYHGNCPDGFGSAWVIHNKFGDEFEYHAAHYSDKHWPDVAGKDVFLTDFTYSKEVILKMQEIANSITIIDHHISAIKKLEEVINVNKYFNVDRSGCVLTWMYFHEESFDRIPDFLLYIEDRDLWKFKLPLSKEITTAILSYDYDFKVWNDLSKITLTELIVEGTALYRKHIKDVKELIKTTKKRIKILDYDVPIANAPYCYASDICDVMNKDEAFALSYYFKNNDCVYFSIRSDSNGSNVDVSEIARKFGGGGHRNAAGFEIKLNGTDLMQAIICSKTDSKVYCK